MSAILSYTLGAVKAVCWICAAGVVAHVWVQWLSPMLPA